MCEFEDVKLINGRKSGFGSILNLKPGAAVYEYREVNDGDGDDGENVVYEMTTWIREHDGNVVQRNITICQ